MELFRRLSFFLRSHPLVAVPHILKKITQCKVAEFGLGFYPHISRMKFFFHLNDIALALFGGSEATLEPFFSE
jgi:hypothetical protein